MLTFMPGSMEWRSVQFYSDICNDLAKLQCT